jgi:hypothetical protein
MLTENVLEFILGGKAFFTIVSERTQVRYTYRVVARKSSGAAGTIHFVSVLRGADNEKDYAYMGCILNGQRFVLTEKSQISQSAPSYIAFAWLFDRLVANKKLPDGVKFYHCGKCARCGRKLTVPSSLETGFGPECAGKVFWGL